jgi:hypothetical protein
VASQGDLSTAFCTSSFPDSRHPVAGDDKLQKTKLHRNPTIDLLAASHRGEGFTVTRGDASHFPSGKISPGFEKSNAHDFYSNSTVSKQVKNKGETHRLQSDDRSNREFPYGLATKASLTSYRTPTNLNEGMISSGRGKSISL